MYINENYYLTAEIADKLSNHLACYSSWSSMEDLLDSGEIVKIGRAVFVRKDSKVLSYNLRERLSKLKMTNFEHLISIPYLKKEFNFDEKYCIKNNLGIKVVKSFNTFGKSTQRRYSFCFFQFNPEYEQKLRKYTLSHIKKEDLHLVKEYIQVSENDYIGMY